MRLRRTLAALLTTLLTLVGVAALSSTAQA